MFLKFFLKETIEKKKKIIYDYFFDPYRKL